MYTPALRRITDPLNATPNHLNIPLNLGRVYPSPQLVAGGHAHFDNTMEQLSNVVGQMRVGSHDSREQQSTPHDDQHSRSPSLRREDPDEAKHHADHLILNAEKFRASVAAPPSGRLDVQGNNSNQQEEPINVNDPRLDQILSFIRDNHDEEFYQITCHVDSKLKTKIQQGEFVELETLIPRNRGQILKEDDRLQQYVTKGGFMYWTLPEKNNKITNVRKWEQAFRVFAAIYCQANPSRSVEIWQYVHTINSAAVSFAWENVYYYDITFRQMMSERPKHSWAKMYSQLWHVAMCDPLPKSSSGANPQV